jgi:hypothetical protein
MAPAACRLSFVCIELRSGMDPNDSKKGKVYLTRTALLSLTRPPLQHIQVRRYHI